MGPRYLKLLVPGAAEAFSGSAGIPRKFHKGKTCHQASSQQQAFLHFQFYLSFYLSLYKFLFLVFPGCLWPPYLCKFSGLLKVLSSKLVTDRTKEAP